MTINKAITILAAVVLAFSAAPARAQSGGIFDLSWNTIDGGGGTFSTGGVFSLGGTIGQFDAGPAMTGGVFSLQGGFWPGAAPTSTCAVDLFPPGGGDGILNFLDLGEFLNLFGAMNPVADFFPPGAPDGVFNFLDLGEFLNQFGAGCP